MATDPQAQEPQQQETGQEYMMGKSLGSLSDYLTDPQEKEPQRQVRFGNFAVRLLPSGALQVHCWPAERLVVSRRSYKDARMLTVKRVKP